MNPKDTIDPDQYELFGKDPDQYELFGKITLNDDGLVTHIENNTLSEDLSAYEAIKDLEYKEYDLEEGDWVIPLEEGITYTVDSLSNGAQFSGDDSYFFGRDVHNELQEEELTEKYSHLKELKDKYTHELDRMKTWEKLTKQQK